MEEIKAEIGILAALNRYIQEEINLLEEDSYMESVSHDVKESYVDETKKSTIEYKCDKCDFVTNTHVTTNTKHPILEQKTKAKTLDLFSDCMYDLFQMKVLNGEQVYAHNVCNRGFDSDAKVKKHIKIDHKDILIEINKHIKENEHI